MPTASVRFATPIFEGAWGRTLSTRYAEAAREANQRWRKCGAGIPKSN